jgi:phage shock protein A
MGIFGRLAQLIKSNLNDLISKSEDPEKMLNQVILEMNAQLVEAKKQVALAIADEKRLSKEFERGRATAEEWERKAMMAVRAGDDDLAKEALLRQKEHVSLATELEKQWQKQKSSVDSLKNALRMLNNKIGRASCRERVS